ncbi:phospholipase A1-Igamma1, chloroplastic-like [Selaginella moellendorffii]|uniref:phospholipase A1-Igamma1, chloroplastic-like n=1 Tax=Selaginella moellendorffii TaxID=88036 RepID=UPI000D1D0FCD|nr:phospholipase A1-Igamma1, chloroplastic-like [Selaginella moellendorffii]|eukprot:XP_024526030.1 phospholipase A1-Igamma1, chloroplastic-like [Selaginella moellendorffii]
MASTQLRNYTSCFPKSSFKPARPSLVVASAVRFAPNKNNEDVSLVIGSKVDVSVEKVLVKELEQAYKVSPIKTLPAPPAEELHPPAEEKKSELSQRWREIQGAYHWEGLLEHPIDPCLRAEIIRYGEFAQACYDAFDMNTRSKYCGSCKYCKKELFDRVDLPGRGYEVTKFLYATADPEIPFFFKSSEASDSPNRDSNWIGYVAVATCEKEIARLGRRDIVVAWRGTVTSIEWSENFKDFLTPAGLDQRHWDKNKCSFLDGVKVENGFLHLYTSKKKSAKKKKNRSAREQLLWEIHRLVGLYKGEQLSITVTGHSLGGALALLSAYDIAESGMDEPLTSVVSGSYCEQQGAPTGTMDPIFESLPRPHNIDDDPTNNIPVAVFSFAAPRVGNDAFRDRCDSLGIKVLRVVNEKDLVPKTPGIFFNENSFAFIRAVIDKLPWTYSHVGQQLQVCSTHSPLLQPTMNPSWHHNLEAHLHLLDGYHGPDKPFSSMTQRDPALVNKAADFLIEEMGIPGFWWQEMHKGLVKDLSGRWVQPHREPHDGDDEDCCKYHRRH